jgi:hypothetical protein
MEHGAIPYGAERLRESIYGHQPFEIKQHIVNFIAEELRHHEASFRIAEALSGYQDEPRADYFRQVIPRFHDERDEKAMPFFAGLAVNTLFEQLSASSCRRGTRTHASPRSARPASSSCATRRGTSSSAASSCAATSPSSRVPTRRCSARRWRRSCAAAC